MERPHEAVRRATSGSPSCLVLDRTPFASGTADYPCVQRVPAHIYAGSYPFWILGYERFLAEIASTWRILAEFPAAEGKAVTENGLAFEFRGLILQRIESEHAA
jgi:hypothetical protein